MHGGLVCLGANACGHPARPMGLADVHRLRPRAQHHRAEKPHQRGKLGRGPENIQVGPLPQPERQHEPTHREPSQHHERNHHQRRQHQHQPKQDIVQRLLRHRRQLDPLQRRPPAEHHQAERTEPTHCLPGRQREREQHSGEHRPDLRADTLRRRSSEGERSHLGDQPGAIRTGQATA